VLTAVFFAAAQAAVMGSISSNSGFASRYSSVVLPLMVLLVGAGVAALRATAAQAAVLAVLVGIGLYLAQGEVRRERTPAPRIAAALEARAMPGDVVAFCPDQLGPALSRALGPKADVLVKGTFPDWSDPARVVWIDYLKRHRESDAEAFAAQADARAGSAAVWLVWSNTYPPTQSSCSALRDELTLLRGGEETVVRDEPWRYPDHAALLRYG
jgi:mannosyltransferase